MIYTSPTLTDIGKTRPQFYDSYMDRLRALAEQLDDEAHRARAHGLYGLEAQLAGVADSIAQVLPEKTDCRARPGYYTDGLRR